MIGTSKMFDKSSYSQNMAKSLQGKVRFSSSMGNGEADDVKADIGDISVSRDFMTSAYEVNDWIRAIVDLTKERACQVDLFPMPINIKDGAAIPDKTKKHMEYLYKLQLRPNKDNEGFYGLKKKIFHDIMVYDEAGMQIVKDKNYSAEMQDISLWSNVSGEELYVNPKADGTLRDTDTYVQVRNQDVIAKFDKNNFMNFIKNRRAGYSNGFSPISTVSVSILGDFEMMNYNYKFFANNARPNIAFIFEQLGFGKGQGALAKAKAWYEQNHQGKPHLPLFMGAEKGNVKLLEMKTTHKDMEFTDWSLMLLSRIMAVYGMQPMVLGVLTDTTGKLNSQVQTEQYKRNAIMPLIKTFLHTYNAALVWNDNNLNFDDVYLTSENLDIDDAKAQSDIDQTYLDRGVVTINQIRSRLQMPPVEWGDEPFVPLNYAPLSTLKDFQEARIADAETKASNTKEDNNTKVSSDAKKIVEEQIRHIGKNYRLPTGLEHIEPSVIKDVFTKIVKEREKEVNKTFSFPYTSNSTIGNLDRFGLDTRKVLR